MDLESTSPWACTGSPRSINLPSKASSDAKELLLGDLTVRPVTNQPGRLAMAPELELMYEKLVQQVGAVQYGAVQYSFHERARSLACMPLAPLPPATTTTNPLACLPATPWSRPLEGAAHSEHE